MSYSCTYKITENTRNEKLCIIVLSIAKQWQTTELFLVSYSLFFLNFLCLVMTGHFLRHDHQCLQKKGCKTSVNVLR
jgi:hypothetical protein